MKKQSETQQNSSVCIWSKAMGLWQQAEKECLESIMLGWFANCECGLHLSQNPPAWSRYHEGKGYLKVHCRREVMTRSFQIRWGTTHDLLVDSTGATSQKMWYVFWCTFIRVRAMVVNINVSKPVIISLLLTLLEYCWIISSVGLTWADFLWVKAFVTPQKGAWTTARDCWAPRSETQAINKLNNQTHLMISELVDCWNHNMTLILPSTPHSVHVSDQQWKEVIQSTANHLLHL